ncbi:MAG: hypothetical protein NVV62_11565 [Terricaulis sp.]|nr:hypothetical protein [Terricaulis sp.]
MSRDAKAETRAINQILWRDWDPIGCGVPEDEYESYVWPIYELLIGRKPRAEIEAYLRWAADEAITVSVADEKTATRGR